MPQGPHMLFERHAEFTRAVGRSRGKVIVIVHPFYARDRQPFFDYNDAIKLQRLAYEFNLKRLISRAKAPVIVMEEYETEMEGVLRQTHAEIGSQNTFFVKTKAGKALPHGGWKALHDVLRQSGVKTVLLGGTTADTMDEKEARKKAPEILRYEKRFNRPATETITFGCVARTYESFINGKYAKVRIVPSIAFPRRPRYGERPALTLWQRVKMQRLLKKKK